MCFYPLGAMMAEQWRIYDSGWTLVAIEMSVVSAVIIHQFARLSAQTGEGIKDEMAILRQDLGAFLLQFILSRGLIIALVSGHGDFPLVPLWFIGSLVMPLIVLAGLRSHIRQYLVSREITNWVPGNPIIEIMVGITLLLCLAAMLLPALAAAKRKAQSINLVNDLKEIEIANRMASDYGSQPGSAGGPVLRLRHDFPETLFWRPEFITDDAGRASVEIPLADSITTWRTQLGFNAPFPARWCGWLRVR